MSATKHTPGPWRYGLAQNYQGFFVAPGNATLTLAAVHNYPAHTEANAKLIAAAPDLLEALKKISNWLACSQIASPEDMAQSFGDMEDLADSAIAKATGGAA